MIDVRIKDQTVLEERELEGSAFELLTEVVTLAACVLDHAAQDESTHTALKNALSETIKRLEYGNIREGHQ